MVMKILLLGASGNVGRLVVAKLLADGHDVVAFVYGAAPFEETDHLHIVQGDVHKEADIRQALDGVEVVMSTLGSWHTKTQDILASAMANAVPAMKSTGISRIITLTGSDARLPGERPTFWQRLLRPVFMVIAPKILRDGETHLRILAESGLAWTTLRSPVMRSKGEEGRSRLTANPPKPWESIHRNDVAAQLVNLLKDDTFAGRAPHIHSH